MFRCFVQKVEQVEHPPLLPDKHGEHCVPLSDWKVEQATRNQKQKKGRTRQEREALTHFDTLRSVSKISRIHRPPRAIARFPDTLPFFLVCRYFRRIYRLPRTLDTLNTLFFQSTRTENFFPIYIYILIFSLARISSKKRCVKCVRWLYSPMNTGKVPTH